MESGSMKNNKKSGFGRFLLIMLLVIAAFSVFSVFIDEVFYGSKSSSSNSQQTASREESSSGTVNLAPLPSAGSAQSTPAPARPVIDPSSVVTERGWSAVMPLPTASEIAEFDKNRTWDSPRSPFVGGWMDTSMCDGYTEYSMEFKADYLSPGTYCCGANFYLDYSVLEEAYESVKTDYGGISGYAGLQYSLEGTPNAIMTIWDQFCTDSSGNQTAVHAKLIYPENESANPNQDMQEGSFVHYLPSFDWKAGRWYRMTLRCYDIPDSDHTGISFEITDLTTDHTTHICSYDLCVPAVCFKGNIAFFLECFNPKTAGEVRSMECRNFQVIDRSGARHNLANAWMHESFDYPGSYKYGSDGTCFYMITTGIPGKVGTLQEPEWFSVSE